MYIYITIYIYIYINKYIYIYINIYPLLSLFQKNTRILILKVQIIISQSFYLYI